MKSIKSLLRRLNARKRKVFWERTTSVCNQSFLESNINISSNCRIFESSIGRGSYIGTGSTIIKARVGRFCSIGSNVEFLLNNHPTSSFVSTHPAFHRSSNFMLKRLNLDFVTKDLYPMFHLLDSGNQCEVGSDVWLGNGVKIMPKVKIGNGAIIGANSLVTKNIPPYAIAFGSPAKVYKFRFSAKVIKALNKQSWWDMDISELRNVSESFINVHDFLEKE